MQPESQWFEYRMALFFLLVCQFHFFLVDAMYFVTSVNVCTMMIEVSIKQSRSPLYIYVYTSYAYGVLLPPPPPPPLLLLLLLCLSLYLSLIHI